jgi:hypothetical protein
MAGGDRAGRVGHVVGPVRLQDVGETQASGLVALRWLVTENLLKQGGLDVAPLALADLGDVEID